MSHLHLQKTVTNFVWSKISSIEHRCGCVAVKLVSEQRPYGTRDAWVIHLRDDSGNWQRWYFPSRLYGYGGGSPGAAKIAAGKLLRQMLEAGEPIE